MIISGTAGAEKLIVITWQQVQRKPWPKQQL